MTDLLTLDQIGPADGSAVGGKGLSLGLLAGAGLPVPRGFCVTAAAYQRLGDRSLQQDPTLLSQIEEAYQALGAGPVAVRSSAAAEDGAVTSFAGQQETVLGVEGPAAVVVAVERCWASLHAARADAYRQRHGAAGDAGAMAVVVQRLVPAEVSGVLFTRDPLDPAGDRMLVEASWGLGESVVAGRVTPDRYHLDRASGSVLDCQPGVKTVMRTPQGEQPVPAERQGVPCLNGDQLRHLAELGRRVEAFYGDARDVEWAWASGQLWLLQARPITTGGAAERERVRREEVAALAARARPGGTVWARFNLAEVLPGPTPMTWAVVSRMMAGRGGFGRMYRDLGYDPDPALDDAGIFDLVCGRPYCNLSREPLMQFRRLPLEHSFAALKADPGKALYPQPTLNRGGATLGFFALLPWIAFQLARASFRLRRQSQTIPDRLRKHLFPAFARDASAALAEDLATVPTPELVTRLELWTQKTLVDFARDGLKPTALAGVALANLERPLARALGPERARAALGTLTLGVRPDPEADLPGAVRDLAAGRLGRAAFLERFGHRGSQEMELAQPRWREDPSALDRLSRTPGSASVQEYHPDPGAWERLADEAGLLAGQRLALQRELDALHTHLGLRETAKHFLMMGYAVLRRLLVELDRRHNLQGGIFYLLPEELPGLLAGDEVTARITQRRRRRTLALSLEVPSVLFSDDLDAVGRSAPPPSGDTFHGVPLSAGVAEGPALVLETPDGAAPPVEPYILVCPSTDPAWVPLFVHARGLVMETGGVLSHGAIVAREFGLPAVAGLPGILRRVRTGQRLRLDGSTGMVTISDP